MTLRGQADEPGLAQPIEMGTGGGGRNAGEDGELGAGACPAVEEAEKHAGSRRLSDGGGDVGEERVFRDSGKDRTPVDHGGSFRNQHSEAGCNHTGGWAWLIVQSGGEPLFDARLDPVLRFLQALGWVGAVGMLVVLYAAMKRWRGREWWLARVGDGLMGVAAVSFAWFLMYWHLLHFSLRY